MLMIVFGRLFAAVTRNTVVLTATRVTRAQPRARQRSRTPLPPALTSSKLQERQRLVLSPSRLKTTSMFCVLITRAPAPPVKRVVRSVVVSGAAVRLTKLSAVIRLTVVRKATHAVIRSATKATNGKMPL